MRSSGVLTGLLEYRGLEGGNRYRYMIVDCWSFIAIDNIKLCAVPLLFVTASVISYYVLWDVAVVTRCAIEC